MRLVLQCNGTTNQTTGILFTDLARVLRERGVEVDLELRSFPNGVFKKVVALLRRALGCWATMREADGLVVHTALSLSLPEMVCARLQRKPVVAFVWDIYPKSAELAGNIRNPLVLACYTVTERFGYALSTRILVPSSDYLSMVPESRGKIALYPLWPRGEIRERRVGSRVGGKRVVFAGQINAIRGLDTAVDRLCCKFPGEHISLDIYSSDETPRALHDLVARKAGGLTIHSLGFVSPGLLDGRLGDYDFGLVPLDPNFELPSFPSKILTYLSAGLPLAYFGPEYPGLCGLIRRHSLGIVLSEVHTSHSNHLDFDEGRFSRGRSDFFTSSKEAQDSLLNYLYG